MGKGDEQGISLTPAELDALAALLEKATPGPWAADPKRLYLNGQPGPIMSYLAGNRAEPEGMKVSIASERIADHHMIAALRNAAPALLAQARRQRAEETEEEMSLTPEKSVPHWVTSWPEWYGDEFRHQNVSVVPKVDYDALAKRAAELEARNANLMAAIREMDVALSRIDYACGPANEMETSAYDVHKSPPAVLGAVQERLAAEVAARENAERALLRKGYRKSCDIPACNCGDQWTHGGHAEQRLYEIREALIHNDAIRNGETILADVVHLAVRAEKAERELAQAREDAERYRWLRSQPISDDGFAIVDLTLRERNEDGWTDAYYSYDGDELDAAIDRARAAEKE